MKATNKLRFVERDSYSKNGEYFTHPHKVRILQQWWETTSMGTMNLGFGGEVPIGEVTGEWRDVPVEKEA
jgi:hypothetical protein